MIYKTFSTLISQVNEQRQSKAVHKSTAALGTLSMPAAPPLETTLAPYTGSWGAGQAGHLLRRTMFGHSYSLLKEVVVMGMEEAVDQLLMDRPMPFPPINYNYADDPTVPIGLTWVNAPAGALLNNYRRRSLAAWTVGQLIGDGSLSIREKMTLFWHNHFVTSDINDPRVVFIYADTLRQNALGNFKDFAKQITVDPAMLIYLNGRENTKFAPNENYARELLELFTIGKGDLAGPGDYTNYTEDDVVAIAKILTGWQVRGSDDPLGRPVQSIFRSNLHDTTTKQLSHRFDNINVPNSGENEYKDLIDIIFAREEVARFICRKLYGWFIHYRIDELIEQNVIEPMAQILLDNEYEIEPALRALLMSEHFYDANVQGCIIKNPYDFTLALYNTFEVEMPQTLLSQYTAWLAIYNFNIAIQMAYYFIPQVAGWKAYYQAPAYFRTWINSNTIPLRMAYTDVLSFTGFRAAGEDVQIDILGYMSEISDPSDPNILIEELGRVLLPHEVQQERITALKAILIPGLPDFEWTVEYNNYLANPDDALLRASVEFKLRNLIRTIMNLPEYNLS